MRLLQIIVPIVVPVEGGEPALAWFTITVFVILAVLLIGLIAWFIYEVTH